MSKLQQGTGLVLVWIALSLIFVASAIALDLRRLQAEADAEADLLVAHVEKGVSVWMQAASKLASLIEHNPYDLVSLRVEAGRTRESLPEMARVALVERVREAALLQLETYLQARGFSDYRVRVEARSADGSALVYPVLMLDPPELEREEVPGRDIRTLFPFAASLEALSRYGETSVLAGTPETGNSLLLMTMAEPARTRGQTVGEQILVAEFSPAGLLPPAAVLAAGSRLILGVAGGRVLAEVGAAGDFALPWEVVVRRWASLPGIRLELQLRRQLLLGQTSWALSGLASALLLAVMVALQTTISGRRRALSAFRNLNAKLRRERDQLEERVHERTIELVRTNSELRRQVKENRTLARKMLRLQEEERRNLARELHDEIGQTLTAIRTDAHLLKQVTGKDRRSLVYQSAAAIDRAAGRIYGVTYGMMRALRPPALDDLGLVDALRGCISDSGIESRGIRVTTRFSGPLNELPDELNICIYRLVQEALNNCIKHAEARNFSLELSAAEDGEVLVVLRDDGRGFDERNVQRGFGLVGMRERIQALGGVFELSTAPGRGTTLRVRLMPDGEEQAE